MFPLSIHARVLLSVTSQSSAPPLVHVRLRRRTSWAQATQARRSRLRASLGPVAEMAAPSYYKRVLPEPCVAFSSPEGRGIFKAALNGGGMECYMALAEQFTTQAEPAYCGLTSLSMVLNALDVDPRRKWKGVWRWYDERLLDCCVSLDVARQSGITMSELVCLAKCQGVGVDTHTFGTFTLDQFREMLKRACSQDKSFIIASYSRKVLNQTGDGHFSPIGGYFQEKDLVLLLDVARFKYPPHWVKTAVLYEAMSRPDSDCGKPRGFVVLSKPPSLPSILVTCSRRFEDWKDVMAVMCGLMDKVHRALEGAGDLSGAQELPDPLRSVLQEVPVAAMMNFLALRQPSDCMSHASMWNERIEALLSEIHGLRIHTLVAEYLESKGQLEPGSDLYVSERLTILMLIGSMTASESLGHGWESALVDMSPSGQQLLTSELIFVTNQLSTLCCTFKVRRPRHHQEAGSSQQCNCRQGSG
mmetsp:Transcript_5967/g.15356  ORF Transcript_5967/g.15356 Transcript_5967/m.15356 type:complete len:473 (+) Transcript_5967:117-1535(+)